MINFFRKPKIYKIRPDETIKLKFEHAVSNCEKKVITQFYETNYGTNSQGNNDLADLFNQNLLFSIEKKLKTKVTLKSIWYQKYTQNNYFGYHTHNVSFSGIYYLNLPSKDLITTFKFKGREFQPNVDEGDLIIFDGYLPHRSPINTSSCEKIIVSFNLLSLH
jgi:hypothetical protein